MSLATTPEPGIKLTPLPVKNQRELLLLILIIIIGALLRLYRLDYQSFWNDEIITIKYASPPISQIITDWKITHLPLYYLIVHPFLILENKELWVRIPSVLFGSLSIPLLFGIIRNWLGKNIAILGAALMAISPLHVWYSQEARPYSLLVFLSLLSLWFFQESLKRYEYLWLKLGFVISVVTLLYCHAVSVAFFGFLIIYALTSVPQRKWKEWIFVFGAIVLLTLPEAFQIHTISSQPSADPNQSFSFLFVLYAIWTFITGFSLGPTVAELHMPDHFNYVITDIHIILPIMLFCCSLLCFGAVKLWKQDKLIFWFVTLWFLITLGNAILGSFTTVHPFNVRYAILAFPPFLIFCAIGIRGLKFSWVPIAALSVTGLICTLSLYNYYFNGRYQRDNNRAAAEFLMAHAKQNDLVIGTASYTLSNLNYYYNAKNDLNLIGFPVNNLVYSKLYQVELDLNEIIANREQFWLFLSRTFHSDPEEYIRNYCEKKYHRSLELKSSGVELVLYTNILNKKY